MRKFLAAVIGVSAAVAIVYFGCRAQADIPAVTTPQVVIADTAPSWLPLGSLWIVTNSVASTNGHIYVQAAPYNTNLLIVYSNMFNYCVTNCNSTNATYTNVLLNFYTNGVPQATWTPIK